MQRWILIVCFAQAVPAADFRAGIATTDITPAEPIFLSGYASRTTPAASAAQRLHAKALALEDGHGARVVIVTTDLIGLPRAISDPVAAEVQKQHGLDRGALLLSSSHTHTGPLMRHNLEVMFDLRPEEQAAADRYARRLASDLITLVGQALSKLEPARLDFGRGEAHFAVNRREVTASGIKLGVNPQGPTDPSLPVLRVSAPNGQLRAVVFGYACHNTTLTGAFNEFAGDYAGWAQLTLEQKHAGTVAMFVELCGGDQNPQPRGTPELARTHGETLAAAVDQVLGGRLERVRGRIKYALQITDLALAHHTRADFAARLEDRNPVRVRHARAMLRTYDEGHPIRNVLYPVQAIAIGANFTLLALGGEPVVDFQLRATREYGARGLMVAGYSNDVMAYIPSKRVLEEGGYESVDSMLYYGMPAQWAPDVEERVFTAIGQVMKRVGRVPAR